MCRLLLGYVGNILRNSSGTPWELDGNTLGTQPKLKKKIPLSPSPLAPKKKT
jgi:hypothetical protein